MMCSAMVWIRVLLSGLCLLLMSLFNLLVSFIAFLLIVGKLEDFYV